MLEAVGVATNMVLVHSDVEGSAKDKEGDRSDGSGGGGGLKVTGLPARTQKK